MLIWTHSCCLFSSMLVTQGWAGECNFFSIQLWTNQVSVFLSTKTCFSVRVQVISHDLIHLFFVCFFNTHGYTNLYCVLLGDTGLNNLSATRKKRNKSHIKVQLLTFDGALGSVGQRAALRSKCPYFTPQADVVLLTCDFILLCLQSILVTLKLYSTWRHHFTLFDERAAWCLQSVFLLLLLLLWIPGVFEWDFPFLWRKHLFFIYLLFYRLVRL